MLQPCLSATHCQEDLREKTFSQGWDAFVSRVRDVPFPKGHPCTGCEDAFACSNCPALAKLEVGDEFAYSEHACRMARARVAKLNELSSVKGEQL